MEKKKENYVRIIRCDGYFLGVNQEGAIWMRPDNEQEKNILDEFIKNIMDNMEKPMEENN